MGLVCVSFITKENFFYIQLHYICIKQSIVMSGFHHSVRFYTAQNPEREKISNNPSLLLIMNLPHFKLIFIYLLTCCIYKLIWKSAVSSPKNNLYPLLTVQLLNSDIHQANVTMTNARQEPG